MPAALRLIHPAPAVTVVALSAALALILAGQAGRPLDWRVALVVASVAASQVATGAINDWADRHRDARVRSDKPISAGQLRPSTALGIGVVALSAQLASSALLGPLTLLLAVAISASAQAYNLALSRTPLSPLPYLVSFGLLPAWIAAGIGVPLERVLGAGLLVAPFAAAAHLANTVRDFDRDAREGSRNLSQLLGHRASRLLAAALAIGVGVGVAAAFVASGDTDPASVLLGAAGLVAIAQGAGDDDRLWYGMLVAAVCWTIGWALATG